MGDYNRSTTQILFESVAPGVMQAVNKHIELHNLGNILNGVTHCIVSKSEKIKKGLFGRPGPKTLAQTVILTNRWLVIANQADQEAPAVTSMQLKDITVEDYEKSLFHSKIPDSGLNVSGRFTDASGQGMFFLPLGRDTAGDRFKEALIKAAQEAKK